MIWQLDKRSLQERIERMRFGEILGSSPAMQEVFRKVERVAGTDITVLGHGRNRAPARSSSRERSTNRSPRAKGPFVSINCGAIPENLLESELFGHVRGAFTGAVASKPAASRWPTRARSLDEIGEMPVALQVKILRALQDRTVTRVGDTASEPVDIRVIAATQPRPRGRHQGRPFPRGPLLPAQRRAPAAAALCAIAGDDVVVLARYLLSRYAQELASRCAASPPTRSPPFKRYHCGNIRELENRIKRRWCWLTKPYRR